MELFLLLSLLDMKDISKERQRGHTHVHGSILGLPLSAATQGGIICGTLDAIIVIISCLFQIFSPYHVVYSES